MKSCIRIPRFRIPRENAEVWPASSFAPAASSEGEEGTAAEFLLPEGPLGEELGSACSLILRNMYKSLWRGDTDKLLRGLILTERKLPYGVRRGLVGAFDLEEFSIGREAAPVSVVSLWNAERAKELAELRGKVPMEFSSCVALYRDKKGKALAEAGSELEQLYTFTLPGGKISGKFIPEKLAQGVAEAMHSRGEPCFVVADGLEEAAAAKAHWEKLKPTLSRDQIKNHPARYFTAEFLNANDPAVRLVPLHRIAAGVAPALAEELFNKNLRCKRQDGVFYLASAQPENVARCDSLLRRLAASCGGEIVLEADAARAVARTKEEGCAAVILPAPSGEELFTSVKELPEPFFTVGAGTERRFALEGREISYD